MGDFTIWPVRANRWAHCPGSIQAEARYQDLESETADDGKIAHELAAPWIDDLAHNRSLVVPDDPRYNSEIIDGVTVYVNHVHDVMRKIGCFTPEIERFVKIPRIHEKNGGRIDCSLWSPAKGVLWIFDFKFGRRVVEHIDNYQLAQYGIGKLDEITDGNGLLDQMITVKMTIVQPRAFHPEGIIRTWTVQGSDLRGHANLLRYQAGKSQEINPPTKAGPHCYRCKAARDCLTLQQAAADVADCVQTLQLHNLSPADRGYELGYLDRAADILNARKDALESEVLTQAQNGNPTPGWGTDTGRGSKVWVKPKDEVVALGDLMGVDLRKPMDVITPTQAINEKKVDADVINTYSKTTPGKLRLVRCNETIAGRMFGAQPRED